VPQSILRAGTIVIIHRRCHKTVNIRLFIRILLVRHFKIGCFVVTATIIDAITYIEAINKKNTVTRRMAENMTVENRYR
jgi:hypothetical protein